MKEKYLAIRRNETDYYLSLYPTKQAAIEGLLTSKYYTGEIYELKLVSELHTERKMIDKEELNDGV